MNRHDFLKTLAAGAASLLVPRWTRGEQSPEVKTFTYKTVDGCEIKLDAIGFNPNVRKPVVVHIHGGALIMGSRRGVPPWLLAQKDRVVISIDYRLAPETKLPSIMEDVQDAFVWIHKQGPKLLNIDARNLVVEGESAGGYLTLMTGFCVKPRPKALISVSGYSGIVGPWYSRPSAYHLQQPHVSKEEANAAVGTACICDGHGPRGKFYMYTRQNGVWPQEVAGHNPETEPDWFAPYCPVQNVSRKYPPTVLIHGTADTDVPYAESDAMDKALTHFKVPHKFISVPGAGHMLEGVADGEKARIFDEALAFVKEHVG
jgi:acetyl esterase/lipase